MSYGNLSDLGFTREDLEMAIISTHDIDRPSPLGMLPDLLSEIVELTRKANKDAGRDMQYGSALAWGITIGVEAERLRRIRVKNQNR